MTIFIIVQVEYTGQNFQVEEADVCEARFIALTQFDFLLEGILVRLVHIVHISYWIRQHDLSSCQYLFRLQYLHIILFQHFLVNNAFDSSLIFFSGLCISMQFDPDVEDDVRLPQASI